MGRDLCMSGCPELVSVRFLMFSRIEDLHPLGNQFLCSITLNLYKFLFKWNFLSFSLCHLTLVLSLDNTGSVALPSYRHPIRYLYLLIRSPRDFSMLNKSISLSHQMLLFLQRFFGSSLDMLCYVLVSFVLGSPDLDTELIGT